jgi:hypothetical protein
MSRNFGSNVIANKQRKIRASWKNIGRRITKTDFLLITESDNHDGWVNNPARRWLRPVTALRG